MTFDVHIIGGGLAGSEAAWQLARRGARVRLAEGVEGDGRFLDLAGLEQVERGFVFARLERRVGRRLGGLGGAWRGAGRCRAGLGRRRGFQLAQPAVEVDVEILLALPGRFEFVAQRFELTAQARIVLAQ